MVATEPECWREALVKIRKVAQIVFSILAILLGGFWFLQGVGVLNVCPILCFADCDCVEGGSRFWSLVGAIVLIVGIITIFITWKNKK